MALRRWSMTRLQPAGRMPRGFSACAQLGRLATRCSPADVSNGPVMYQYRRICMMVDLVEGGMAHRLKVLQE
jgi:hypothetical protein